MLPDFLLSHRESTGAVPCQAVSRQNLVWVGVQGAAACACFVSRAALLFAGCYARAGALGRSSRPGQVPGRFLSLHAWSLVYTFTLCHLAAPGSQQQEENLAVPLQDTPCSFQAWPFSAVGFLSTLLIKTKVHLFVTWKRCCQCSQHIKHIKDS